MSIGIYVRSYSCQLGTKSDPAAWSAILPPDHTNKQNPPSFVWICVSKLGHFKAIPQCFIFEVSLLKLQQLQRLAGCKCPSQVNISSCFLAYIHAFLLQGIRWATTHFGQSSGFTGRCFGFCVRCGHDSIFARRSRRKTIVFCWKSWKPWQTVGNHLIYNYQSPTVKGSLTYHSTFQNHRRSQWLIHWHSMDLVYYW